MILAGQEMPRVGDTTAQRWRLAVRVYFLFSGIRRSGVGELAILFSCVAPCGCVGGNFLKVFAIVKPPYSLFSDVPTGMVCPAMSRILSIVGAYGLARPDISFPRMSSRVFCVLDVKFCGNNGNH